MPNALDELNAAFPWLGRLGLNQQLHQWTVEGFEGEALMGLVRQTSQYQNLFPSIKRPDGTLRMNEAQYLQTADQYREILRSFGQPDYSYDSPWDVAVFFENEIRPDVLQQRFQVYDEIRKGGMDEVRDTFYVYAGIDMSEDDLYTYVVSPQARQTFDSQYNEQVAGSQLDYETWITRATDLGLQKVVRHLENLEREGVVTGTVINQVRNLDPNFARQMADVLYTGGDTGEAGGFLGLNELMNAFQYALIGGAALQQGLSMPSLERVQAIRSAGVERAKALEQYSVFARQQGQLQGMVQRAGGGQFGQDEFERAVFLQSAPEQELLRRAQAQEDALGRRQGAAQFSSAGGGLAQTGLRARY